MDNAYKLEPAHVSSIHTCHLPGRGARTRLDHANAARQALTLLSLASRSDNRLRRRAHGRNLACTECELIWRIIEQISRIANRATDWQQSPNVAVSLGSSTCICARQSVYI